ncbi:MAG: type II restriction endonuclease [Acidobacteria bacterium]|nr:type II restriction endonuclease [Acidobacteriota bacterium]
MQTELTFSDHDPIRVLLARWKADPNATYQTWFLWEDRLKNFRSIRRGIGQVIAEIDAGTFGNAYKGSSLETVVGSIAEQRQIFKGADHAFLWKPKLRIPDIYENRDNQLAFARFLNSCVCCTGDEGVIAAIRNIETRRIKGLGPAAANLIYFVHPTIAPPFNTAIVKGYNALTGANVKLGRWDEYLTMRSGIVATNLRYQDLLSNDLGAIAGVLFDLGSGRYSAPPREDDEAARATWEADIARVREEGAKAEKLLAAVRDGDRTHAEVQGWLRDLGSGLGFQVWVASNDRGRPYGGGRLSDGCLEALPEALAGGPGGDAVRLIDVLWLEGGTGRVAAAFEVEHTTSIYSGIVRLLDLALGAAAESARELFLVAPDDREEDVRAQLARPAFSRVGDLRVRFLPYSELETHRHSMARFGQGMKAVEAVARALS